MRRRAMAGRPWIVLATVVASLALTASAGAADRLYGTSINSAELYSINLDGSGSGTVLSTAPTTPTSPWGLALDPATNRLYWSDAGATSVSRVALDGTGGDVALFQVGDSPMMVAIDPASNGIYWPDFTLNRIMRGNLDGTGAAVAIVSGPPVSGPIGIAIDPAGNSLYWANSFGNTIARANLDGSNATVIASANDPIGIAIDPASNSLYWANSFDNTIMRANLDGTAAAALPLTPGSVDAPTGLAVDPDASRIYWANSGNNTVFGASVSGTGASPLSTGSVVLNTPGGLAILKAPSSAGLPIVTGGAFVGDVLTCAPDFAPDLPGSQLYQRPATTGFQWSLDGADIGGATNPTIATAATGAYRCQTAGTNLAGSASAISAAHAVTVAPPPSPGELPPLVTSLSPASGPVTGGTVVTIAGTRFGSVSAVLFGDVPAAFTVDRFDRVTAVAPPHGVGAVRVTVRSPTGTSAPSTGDTFDYRAVPAPPVVTPPAVAPSSSTPTGGCTVPRLTGASRSTATRRASAAGCRVGRVTGHGRKVKAQSPPAGTHRSANARVSIRLG